MTSEELKAIQRRLETLKKRYPDYTPYFDFFAKTVLTRKQFPDKPQITVPEFSEEMINLKAQEGFFLLEHDQFPIDLELSKKLFFLITGQLKELKDTAVKAQKIGDYFETHQEELATLFDQLLKGQEIKVDELDTNLLKFIVMQSLKPSIEATVESLAPKLKDISWYKGYCPICGGYPYIAALRENGKKFGKCVFCGYEWQIERIFCPYCGIKDHKQLKYFEVEEEKGYRVYLCDNCKHYLKTVDERELAEVADLELEDLATIHLDILAQKEGYQKMGA